MGDRIESARTFRPFTPRAGISTAALAAFLLASTALPVSAQPIVNPRAVEFSASTDHSATLPDGRPMVTSYLLQVYQAGASLPFTTVSMGKPAPGTDGLIRYDFSQQLGSWPLGVVFEVRVAAEGPTGIGLSAPSNQFRAQPSSCTYYVSPSPLSLPTTRVTTTLTVTTQPGCPWTATSNTWWLATSSPAGIGSGSFVVSSAANPAQAPRVAALAVASQIVPVTQQADPGASHGSWVIVGTGDFNGDQMPDLLWEGPEGHLAVWTMNGFDQVSADLLYPHPVAVGGWHVRGVGDLNGDGMPDLIWENGASGHVAGWIMNGLTQVHNALFSFEPAATGGWHVAGTGDFNGDVFEDLLWRHDEGHLAVWYMNGMQLAAAELMTTEPVEAGWRVAGTGDFNADGLKDIAWQNEANGAIAAWIMNRTQMAASVLLWPDPVAVQGWSIAGTGDFNRDLNTDLIWQNLDGWLSGWLMNGLSQVSAVPLNPGRVY